MPIGGPASYVPTLNEFVPHWGSVNSSLGAAGPLVLGDGATLLILTGHRDALAAFALSIHGKLNDVEIARETIELTKIAILARLGEFNRKVRGFLGKSAFVQALPEAPSVNASAAVVLDALDDMATLWPKINAATIPGFAPPLTLLGAYPTATFLTDLATLKTAYATWQNALQDLTLERERRNDLQDVVYPILRDYRAAVIGTFDPNDALVASLPRLSPEPGSTPNGVIAAIVWDAIQQKAKITWTESTDPNLERYEIRFCPGPDYSTDDESVIGSVLSGEAREFFTDAGLAASGNVASFKVYVITTTGNEKGGNTVTITRP